MNLLKRRGFTLVELLIAIAIIGVIVTASIASFSNIRQKGRDTQRVADIKTLQKALESYYRHEGQYPATITPGQALVGSTSAITYLEMVPSNPGPQADGSCAAGGYVYSTQNNNSSYTIEFCLGETTSYLPQGSHCATPNGTYNESCSPYTMKNFENCGDTGIYMGTPYSTVQIGTQCWMDISLNFGTRINSCAAGVCDSNCNFTCYFWGTTPLNQADADNYNIQKYCSNDDPANCDEYGALYQWHTAMRFPASCDTVDCSANPTSSCCNFSLPHQGICPTGWHIPSLAEFEILENYIGMFEGGAKLKEVGTTHWESPNTGASNEFNFNGLGTGYRLAEGNVGSFFRKRTNFWTTTIMGSYGSSGTYRGLTYDATTFDLGTGAVSRKNGHSIRCLKD